MSLSKPALAAFSLLFAMAHTAAASAPDNNSCSVPPSTVQCGQTLTTDAGCSASCTGGADPLCTQAGCTADRDASGSITLVFANSRCFCD